MRRNDFPVLLEKMNEKRLCYLDNAATSLKPKVVVDEMNEYYLRRTSNVHRGVYPFSEINTDLCEQVRISWQEYLNAEYPEEIIFTGGTTFGLNLLSHSLGEILRPGDEVVISELEHHANIVPWQLLASRKEIKISVIPLKPDGTLNEEEGLKLITNRTKILSLSLASNTTGYLTPFSIFAKKAREVGAWIIADAAQYAPHFKIDVKKLDCDFLVLSGHKFFGPTGIGILFGKKELLELMPPFLGGGNMIDQVSLERTTFHRPPFKFEAGTPPIAEILGLGAALKYAQNLEWSEVEKQETLLGQMCFEKLSTLHGIKIYGPQTKNKLPIFAFMLDGVHPHDLGQVMGQYGVAIRTGHHCTQPLLKHFNLTHLARASFSFYNNEDDIEQFIDALKRATKLLLG